MLGRADTGIGPDMLEKPLNSHGSGPQPIFVDETLYKMIMEQAEESIWNLEDRQDRNPFDPTFYDFRLNTNRTPFSSALKSAIDSGVLRVRNKP